MREFAQTIWSAIVDGQALRDPSLLNHFLVYAFGDLKKWHFYYWTGFPAFVCPLTMTYNVQSLTDHPELLRKVAEASSNHAFPSDYFLIVETEESCEPFHIKEYDRLKNGDGKIHLGFWDPSNDPTIPGWPLRNFLILAVMQWGVTGEVSVLGLRESVADCAIVYSASIVLQVHVEGREFEKEMPDVVGWERNARGKMGPRMANMASSMDPGRWV